MSLCLLPWQVSARQKKRHPRCRSLFSWAISWPDQVLIAAFTASAVIGSDREANHIVASSCCFNRSFQGVSVIRIETRIEEDWVIEPLAQAGDHSSNLAHTQKATLTFGRADDDWRF